tara:strand:+ start:3434 stop:3619 length:186 start_codon:yes stop_codon:yes gene_type:complete
MSTKLVIVGKKGQAINGKNAFIEVNGEQLHGQFTLDVKFNLGEVATATVSMVLPEIEYRDE